MPYPEPTSANATKIGKANRRSETKCEVLLRSELHRRGLRFRKDLLIRTSELRTHADVAFTRARLAVFVDGCFWHMCPEHAHLPKSNLAYWVPKLEANVARDRRVDESLTAAGWEVLRIWEHVPPSDAADLVETCLRRSGYTTSASWRSASARFAGTSPAMSRETRYRTTPTFTALPSCR